MLRQHLRQSVKNPRVSPNDVKISDPDLLPNIGIVLGYAVTTAERGPLIVKLLSKNGRDATHPELYDVYNPLEGEMARYNSQVASKRP